MAQTPEPAPATEIGSDTKKIVNPRAEIDTSPPFGSVKEAVTRFEGSASWIPHHLLRLATQHGIEYDLDKVEEQASELEKDLIVKEMETLSVLKDLEATKRFVEGLKVKLVKEVSECMTPPELSSSQSLTLCPAPSPGLIVMELNQAKLNLNKSTNDLAAIQASVESLNNKMKKEKVSIEKPPDKVPNCVGVLSMEEKLDRARAKLQLVNNGEIKGNSKNSTNVLMNFQQLNFEADQFKKIAEAAKYEVMKAMSEIEQTKTSINMVEMRLIAARKMEEAARAVEEVAFAEMNARSCSEGVTLSFEEYSCLAQKAQKADEMSKKRGRDVVCRDVVCRIDESNVSEVAILKKAEETMKQVKQGKKFQEEAKIEAASRRSFVTEEAFFGGRMEQHGEIREPGHHSMFKFKNSCPSYGHCDSHLLDGNKSNLMKEKTVPVLRSTISIGDILSRKLILQDDFMVGSHVEGHNERQHASLSQMLREQSGLIFQPKKGVKEGIVHKQFFSQRKKFGFIDISLPMTKQNKKKSQAPNTR
ncbi:WEB family protein [Camellia lanceoleosa]|uniref:WEB family protein n=1 Tax=Camellia lanceoleosa TaxID=1840588 RepID=A0ACC0IYJ2_9ERIC|nr:WEB family protein [Camellia lanceoleosa]